MDLKIYFRNSTEKYITQLSGSNKNITYTIKYTSKYLLIAYSINIIKCFIKFIKLNK